MKTGRPEDGEGRGERYRIFTAREARAMEWSGEETGGATVETEALRMRDLTKACMASCGDGWGLRGNA